MKSAGSTDKNAWLVMESLPLATDADPTLPMNLQDEIPSSIGVLLQKEDKIPKDISGGKTCESKPSDPPAESVAEPGKARLFKKI